MPWVVGVDEAGYGPNLGPLVMASVAYQLRDHEPKANLWRILKKVVRRASDESDSRLVIDDSKRVYSSTKGLAELERSICGALLCRSSQLAITSLSGIIEQYSDCAAELQRECWYRGQTAVPIAAPLEEIVSAAGQFAAALEEAGISQFVVRCDIVCPQRFNEGLERWDSKAALLALGLTGFIRYNRQTLTDEPLHFFIDKHGGRNFYSALLQHAIDDGIVLAEVEGNRRSFYRVHGCSQEMCFTFQPEADGSHFCVALASMLCKYLREALMHEFNAFWQQHIPGLKPTAGYPGDAARFYDEIRGTCEKIGLADHAIWRRR